MLKAILASLEGLDDATAKLYTKEAEGKFILNVDGLVDKGKLDEFRASNVDLKKQLDQMKDELSKFSGVDLKKYQDAMAAIESDVEKKLMKEGKIDEVIQMRTEKMRTAYEEQLKAKDAAIQAAQKERELAITTQNSYMIESELTRHVTNPESGFHANVIDLVKDRMLKEFTVKDGKVIRVKEDGSPVFGAKGDPATIEEFLQDIVKDHSYLIKSSSGGGSQNNRNNTNGQKTMRRSEFDAIQDPVRKHKLMKDGTQLVD